MNFPLPSVRHRLVEGHARDHHVAQELLRRLDIPERGVAAHAAVQQLLPSRQRERGVVRAERLLERLVALHALAARVQRLALLQQRVGVGRRAEQRRRAQGRAAGDAAAGCDERAR
jgi:hypothetical protein